MKLLIQIIISLIILSSCAKNGSYVDLENRDQFIGKGDLKNDYTYYDLVKKKVETSSMPSLYSEFISRKVALAKAPTDLVSITNYINSGIALSNKSCALWFDGQYTLDRKVNQRQNLFSLIRTLAVTALTFESKSAKTIGAVSLGFDGINQGYEFFKENFLLTNTLLKLREHVISARQGTADILKNKMNTSYNYFEAQTDLSEYHFTCHPMALRGYIDASVDITRYVPTDSGENLINKAKVIKINFELYFMLMKVEGVFSTENLWNLYLQIFGGDTQKSIDMLTTNLLQKAISDRLDATICAANTNCLSSIEFGLLLERVSQVAALLGYKEKLDAIKAVELANQKLVTAESKAGLVRSSCIDPNLPTCAAIKNELIDKKNAELMMYQALSKDWNNTPKSLTLKAVPQSK